MRQGPLLFAGASVCGGARTLAESVESVHGGGEPVSAFALELRQRVRAAEDRARAEGDAKEQAAEEKRVGEERRHVSVEAVVARVFQEAADVSNGKLRYTGHGAGGAPTEGLHQLEWVGSGPKRALSINVLESGAVAGTWRHLDSHAESTMHGESPLATPADRRWLEDAVLAVVDVDQWARGGTPTT